MNKDCIMKKMKEKLGPESEQYKKILSCIAENSKSMSYFLEEKFCHECQCNREELEDFLQKCGYSSYEAFAADMRDSLSDSKKDLTDEETIFHILDDMIEIEANNVRDFRAALDVELVKQMARDIMNAPEVILLSTRVSNVITQYAAYLLNRIGIRTTKIDSADTNYMESVNNMDRAALVISVGFARYHRSTILSTRYLKKKGFKVVAVTDFVKSPLIPISDYSFVLKANSYGFTDSYSTAILLINLIVLFLEKINGENVSKKLLNFEDVSKELNYYI